MSAYDRVEMPTTPQALGEMLRWAHRRGYASGVRSVRSPAAPRGLTSCEDHPVFDEACLTCIEADAYCPHGHLLMHPDAPPDAPCWRPRYTDDLEEEAPDATA